MRFSRQQEDGKTALILVGLRLPEPGCWEITGQYDDDSVSVVVWIAAAP